MAVSGCLQWSFGTRTSEESTTKLYATVRTHRSAVLWHTHIIASTPLQYRSHIDLYLGWPARHGSVTLTTCGAQSSSAPATSQIFRVMFPRRTLRKLNATVGTTSSLHYATRTRLLSMREMKLARRERTWPEPMTFTKDVFPDALPHKLSTYASEGASGHTCSPTTDISACLEKNSLRSGSQVKYHRTGRMYLPTKPLKQGGKERGHSLFRSVEDELEESGAAASASKAVV